MGVPLGTRHAGGQRVIGDACPALGEPSQRGSGPVLARGRGPHASGGHEGPAGSQAEGDREACPSAEGTAVSSSKASSPTGLRLQPGAWELRGQDVHLSPCTECGPRAGADSAGGLPAPSSHGTQAARRPGWRSVHTYCFSFLREARGIFQAENTVCGSVSRTEGARTLVSRLGAGGGRGPRRGPLLSPSLARRLQLSLSLKDVTEGDSRPGADLASVLTGLKRVNNSSLRYFWPGTVRPDARLRCRQELPKGRNSHCGEIKDVPAGRNAAEPGDGPGRGHLSSWLWEGRARVGGRSRAGRGASCGHLGDDELPCCH